ncbi:MAG: tetratricopeptide repeat protein, partial [Spirochaetales bacterium]|nr:tetratricopeptide repeat protein [Spirochaetales bacterium]
MKRIQINLFAFIFVLLQLSASLCFADAFSEGEKLYSENRPLDALIYFQKALEENPKNPSAYNLLGLCYYQLADYEASQQTFVKGCELPSKLRYILYYNAGNAAFAMGDYENAEIYYTASIELNPDFPSAVLNRGNTRLKLNVFKGASEDYKRYLELEPDTNQREQIEKLIYEANQAWYEQEREKINYEMQEELLQLEIQRLLTERETRKLEYELRLKKSQERNKELMKELEKALSEKDEFSQDYDDEIISADDDDQIVPVTEIDGVELENDGLVDESTAEDGLVEDGLIGGDLVEESTAEDGSVENGLIEGDLVDESAAEDGSVVDGSVENGSVDESTAEKGSSDSSSDLYNEAL